MAEPTEEPLTHDSDRLLVRRLAAGDSAAFDEFWGEHAPRLYRFVRSRLHGDADLTREIVQSALCKALDSLDNYRGAGSFFSWICGICRYEILGYIRTRQRDQRLDPLEPSADGADGLLNSLESGESSPEAALLREEARRRIHEVLEHLPSRHARVLEWKYAEHLPVREIAARLELSEKAAESLLTRARSAFRQSFSAPTKDSPGLKH